MKMPYGRIWTLFIAAAFAVLWCVSAGISLASSGQSSVSDTTQAMAQVAAPNSIQAIGIMGWCLVGLGFLGVALTVALGGRPKKRRKMVRIAGSSRHPSRVTRSIYSPPYTQKYYRNTQRRR